jgi:hypothetical protein
MTLVVIRISGTLGCVEWVAQKHSSPGNRSGSTQGKNSKKKLTESKLSAK